MTRLRLRIAKPDEIARPLTRGDCADVPRPCPFVTCRHHLYLDVSVGGTVRVHFDGMEPDEIPETCSLDVADGGAATLEQVGQLMGCTRERIRQLEARALGKLKRKMRVERSAALRDYADHAPHDGDGYGAHLPPRGGVR